MLSLMINTLHYQKAALCSNWGIKCSRAHQSFFLPFLCIFVAIAVDRFITFALMRSCEQVTSSMLNSTERNIAHFFEKTVIISRESRHLIPVICTSVHLFSCTFPLECQTMKNLRVIYFFRKRAEKNLVASFWSHPHISSSLLLLFYVQKNKSDVATNYHHFHHHHRRNKIHKACTFYELRSGNVFLWVCVCEAVARSDISTWVPVSWLFLSHKAPWKCRGVNHAKKLSINQGEASEQKNCFLFFPALLLETTRSITRKLSGSAKGTTFVRSQFSFEILTLFRQNRNISSMRTRTYILVRTHFLKF